MITAINIKNILIPTTRIINNTTRLLIVNNRRFQSTESTSTSEKSSHDATSKPVEYYDIVICGGGMVGTAMARSLAKDSLFKNLKIALVESSPKSGEYKKPEIYKNRICAINDKSIQLFKTLDCFDFIEQNRYGIVKHMHVWDGSSDSFITFHGDQLALTIENDLIQASLSHNIDKFENLDVIYSSEIKDFKSSADNVNIKLNNGKELNTKLLIGSDGANSFIRNKAEFKITKWDYDQVGIVATLKLADVGFYFKDKIYN